MLPALRAIRMMRRSPGFTAAAILTVTLGIARTRRPLPLAGPDRLVSISTSNPARGLQGGAFSVASYEYLGALALL